MGKLLLLSLLLATIALPMWAASDPSPLRGLRRAMLWLVGFNVFYLIAIIYIFPRVG